MAAAAAAVEAAMAAAMAAAAVAVRAAEATHSTEATAFSVWARLTMVAAVAMGGVGATVHSCFPVERERAGSRELPPLAVLAAERRDAAVALVANSYARSTLTQDVLHCV